MVKKLQQMADKKSNAAAGLLDSQFASTVKESAQQIWLAGLGAFSRAQAEGGKVFDSLVKEGTNIQRKTQTAAEEKLSEVSSRMSGMASEVSAKAGQHWDKLESIFEERTARALARLGVPSAKDVAALLERVEALSAQVAELSQATPTKAGGAKAAAGPAVKAGAKTAAKTTATKTATKTGAKRSAKPASATSATKPATAAKRAPAKRAA